MMQLNFDAVVKLPWPLRYILAVSLVALATALRFALLPTKAGVPFVTFYPAIMITFYLCGTGPGIFSVLLSTLSAFYFFFAPYNTLEWTPESIRSSSAFVISASICGYFVILVNYYRKSLNEAELQLANDNWHKAAEDLKLAIDGAKLGLWTFDPTDGLVSFSDIFGQHFGLPVGVNSVSYGKILDIIHPLDRSAVDKSRETAVSKQVDFVVEHRVIWPDASEHWIYGHGRPFFYPDGSLQKIIGISMEVSALKSFENSSISRAATIRAAFENMEEGILIGDTQGNLLDTNDSAASFLRFRSIEELPKTYVEFMALLELSTLEGHVLSFAENPYILALQGKHQSSVMKIRRKDINEEWYGRISFSPIRKGQTEIIGAAITGLDVSDRIQTQKRLEALVAERTAELMAANLRLIEVSRHDILTGLHNRLACDEHLASEFVRMKRTGHSYGILIADIDHFKCVNDSLGHATGDEVLKLIANTLSKNLRESDFISRWGGEEFLILLPNTNVDNALIAAEKLLSAVAAVRHPTAGQITMRSDANGGVLRFKRPPALHSISD